VSCGAGLLGQLPGSSIYFTSDVVAQAKRNLSSGEVLDGEGGYTVYGGLRPAAQAVQAGELPVVYLKNAPEAADSGGRGHTLGGCGIRRVGLPDPPPAGDGSQVRPEAAIPIGGEAYDLRKPS